MQVITAWTSMRQSLPLQIVTAALLISPSRTGNQIATPALLQIALLMNRLLFGVAEQLESSEYARGHGFGGLFVSDYLNRGEGRGTFQMQISSMGGSQSCFCNRSDCI